MLGLIRKDLYYLGSGWKLLLLSILIISGYATSHNAGAIVIVLLPTFFGLSVLGCVQQDAQKKWYDYHKVLPISVRGIVSARYLAYLSFVGAGFLITAVYGYGIQFTIGIEALGTRFAMWQGFLLGWAIALAFAALFLPATYYTKGEKMEMSMILSGFLSFGSIRLVMFVLKLFDINLVDYTDIFIQLLFAAAIIAFCISWLLSLCIYQNRIKKA